MILAFGLLCTILGILGTVGATPSGVYPAQAWSGWPMVLAGGCALLASGIINLIKRK